MHFIVRAHLTSSGGQSSEAAAWMRQKGIFLNQMIHESAPIKRENSQVHQLMRDNNPS